MHFHHQNSNLSFSTSDSSTNPSTNLNSSSSSKLPKSKIKNSILLIPSSPSLPTPPPPVSNHSDHPDRLDVTPAVLLTPASIPTDSSNSNSLSPSLSQISQISLQQHQSLQQQPSLRISPALMALLNSPSFSLSSSLSSLHKSPLIPSSEGSSARSSHPTSSALPTRPTRNFSPCSLTTTDQTSLPHDAASSPSHSDQSPLVGSGRPTKSLTHYSDRTSSLFGIDNSSDSHQIPPLSSYSPRPSTSVSTHLPLHPPHLSLDRPSHSSLSPTQLDHPHPPSSREPKRMPSFNFSAGDQGIEELLETLGYSSALSNSNSLASLPNSSHNLATHSTLQSSHSRAPAILLDIDGHEFSLLEHSLSPVSERTELETNSSKTSGNRRPHLPASQASLSRPPFSQHGLHPTPPLCLSPKHNHLSPPSSTSSASRSSPLPLDQTRKKIVSSPALNSMASNDIGLHIPFQASQSTGSNTNRPSIQRMPKKTTELIQLFEAGSSSSSLPISNSPLKPPKPVSVPAAPTNRLQYSSIQDSTAPRPSALQALEASRQSRAARAERQFASEPAPSAGPSRSPILTTRDLRPPLGTSSPATRSIDSFNSATLPDLTEFEKDRIRLRTERRERTAMAEKGHVGYLTTLQKLDLHQSSSSLRSPMSDRFLQHRKSISSSITSNLSDVKVLHSGSIWYRNPQTNEWKETRGILTPEALYLMNENGQVDKTSPDQSIELVLRGCTSVESVRSKRSYGPNFSEPHLHMLRIAWVEFDHRSNSRVEHEEFLGCTRATQRADWVGAIWQAAHDLGGFIDQPDIPLAGKTSSSSASPKQVDSEMNINLSTSHSPNLAPIACSLAESSPRLDPVSLVDRSMSTAITHTRQPSPSPSVVSPCHHQQANPLPTQQPNPLRKSYPSSSTSQTSAATTNLHSELARDLNAQGPAHNLSGKSPASRLYSEDAAAQLRQALRDITRPEVTHQNYPIDPNLERNPTRPKSPELDIFAMVERMSVKGSISKDTAQFYDPPRATSLQRQSSQDVHTPRPISVLEHANVSALEQDAIDKRSSSSRHSYHTMPPMSATGIHEKFGDSPRSSAPGSWSRSTERHRQLSSTPQPDPGRAREVSKTPTERSQQHSSTESARGVPSGPFNGGLREPVSPRNGRGAWSDIERLSNQTDNVLAGPAPARAVQRDLRRILKTIERNDSHRAAASESLGQYLDNIHHQLRNVAAKLRGHEPERDPGQEVTEGDEPTIADKVDYMLSLCNILLESQHKVSTAVEKNLRAHGLSINKRSTHTRSLRSNTNPSRRSSRIPDEPGMPGPAPLTPMTDSSMDEDHRPESPPLPPLPDTTEEDNGTGKTDEPSSPPAEVLPPVAVQEAGLGRIENLLVALLSRMDEAAQRQQPEPPPPVPEKDSLNLQGTRPLSVAPSERPCSTVDLDADVALWKSRGKGVEINDLKRSWNEDSHRGGSQNHSDAPLSCVTSNYSPTEPETPVVPDQPHYHDIPDYNRAYDAEDEVARRIADERARAARRLEGISTPYGYRHSSIGRNAFPAPSESRVPSQSRAPRAAVLPPNQDPVGDSYRQSLLGDNRGPGTVKEQSYWSCTTPSPNDQTTSAPPLPPKDEQSESPPATRAAPSVRACSRTSSTIISRLPPSQPAPITPVPAPASEPAPAPAPVLVQPQITPDELRGVVQEVLQHHSTEQAPVLDEMVTLLRTQDQVNQASVLNQAEVSRYLGQLNVHLEGVLQKKNSDIERIGENVGRLEKQLAILLEQSEKMAANVPTVQYVEKPMASVEAEQMPTSVDQADEGGEGQAEVGIQLEDEPGADGPVDRSVPQANEGDGGEELAPENAEPHVSPMTKKPSASYRIGGPRARKISLGKSFRGPRMPNGLSSVGKLWGGPVPAADRAARWGTGPGGGSLKRTATRMTNGTQGAVNVEEALAGVNGGDPAGQEAMMKQREDGEVDDKAGTIALGVSHILKFLKENTEKEEARRQKKQIEKETQPKPAIPNEMEERRAKIEELQMRREATLAEDKAKRMESMMQAMRQQAAEHDRLLKKIAEDMESKRAEKTEEEEEKRRRWREEEMEGVNRVLTTVESGVMSQIEDFKAQLMNEVKELFEKVGELREQKAQVQSDMADMVSFLSKVRGGAPDPRWQYPSPAPTIAGGGIGEGSVMGGTTYHNNHHQQQTSVSHNAYPSPQMDYQDREGLVNNNDDEIGGGGGGDGLSGLSKSGFGFGPRPPGRR